MFQYSIKKTTLIFLFSCIFGMPVVANGAEILFASKTHSVASGEDFLLNVFLNSENESVNATDGKIVFPGNLLEVKEIRDGNSIINFWIERPKSSQSSISFSGVTPGGFSGQKDVLFSVVFRAKKEGKGLVSAEGIRVLRNDGEGTEASLKTSPFSFSVSQAPKSPLAEVPDTGMIQDTEPPEDFKPTVVSDTNFFGGKQVLIFSTEDKGSGIDHYEVREGKVGWFSVAESPYLLKHQWLDREVFVKAVDKTGNERIAILLPETPTPPAESYAVWGVGGVLLLIFILFFKKIYKRFSSRKKK